LHPLDLALQLFAQLQIEGAKRFVEQQHLRPDDDRPRQRHALLLPARQFRGIAMRQLLQPHQAKGLPRPLIGLAAGDTAHPHAEGDIGGNRLVRKQRVGLEHHPGVAPMGGTW
jgi:hypothetical protein